MKELPRDLALAQLRLRSITAGLAVDCATLPIGAPGALAIDSGRDGYGYDQHVTIRRYSCSDPGSDPRMFHVSVRTLIALARLESDSPARAPIREKPPRLSAPPPEDRRRIAGMLEAVLDVMKDGKARTLDDIQETLALKKGLRHETPAISARLRDLRKAQFGGHTVERQKVAGNRGLFRYRLVPGSGQ